MTRRGLGRGARGGAGGGRGRGTAPSASGQVNSSSPSTLPAVVAQPTPDICQVCSLVVGQDCVGCDRCPAWFHATPQCTGLATEAIDLILGDGGDAIAFICCSCRSQPGANPANDNSLVLQHQMFEMIKSLAASVAQITQQVATLNSSIQNLNTTSNTTTPGSPLSRDAMFAEFREYDERKKRRDSLIVRGLVCTADNDFPAKFGDLTAAITGSRVAVQKVHCISKPNHIYRVDIVDRDSRVNILQNAKKLKDNSQFSRVYINRDLTYQQRQDAKSRRSELRALGSPNHTPLGDPGHNLAGVPTAPGSGGTQSSVSGF